MTSAATLLLEKIGSTTITVPPSPFSSYRSPPLANARAFSQHFHGHLHIAILTTLILRRRCQCGHIHRRQRRQVTPLRPAPFIASRWLLASYLLHYICIRVLQSFSIMLDQNTLGRG
jgi:hypothetical protein